MAKRTIISISDLFSFDSVKDAIENRLPWDARETGHVEVFCYFDNVHVLWTPCQENEQPEGWDNWEEQAEEALFELSGWGAGEYGEDF